MINRIKLERARIGITQAQLAAKVKVSRQAIHAIEKGKYVPSTVLALRMADVFNCSVHQIFELEDSEK